MDLKQLQVAINSSDGILILEYLSNFCGEKNRSFVADNTHQTAFNEGKKSSFS